MVVYNTIISQCTIHELLTVIVQYYYNGDVQYYHVSIQTIII